MSGAAGSQAVRIGRALVLCAFGVAGLTACVTPVPEQLSMLNKAAVCCASMQEFNYIPLTTVDDREVRLTAESPAFIFDTGKSFFAAYSLPPWKGPYQIRAEAEGSTVRGGLFGPSALMLDADFRITRRFNVAPDAGSNARPGIVHIFVNEPNQNEHYLVLFTGRLSSSGGVDTLIATPTVLAIGAVPVQIGATESRVSLRYSPTGTLQLRVWPYQPQRAGQSPQ